MYVCMYVYVYYYIEVYYVLYSNNNNNNNNNNEYKWLYKCKYIKPNMVITFYKHYLESLP